MTHQQQPPEIRTVRIPGSSDHAGHHAISVDLAWVCPVCGGPRGEPHPAISYDGSRRLACDGSTNPCGHIDHYANVRAEAAHASHQATPPAHHDGGLPGAGLLGSGGGITGRPPSSTHREDQP